MMNQPMPYQDGPMKACCLKCRFFHLPHRWCRRFPPKIIRMLSGAIVSHYPVVDPDGWCGEYRPNERTGPSGFRKFD